MTDVIEAGPEVEIRLRRAPNGLGTQGKALWNSVRDSGYGLRPDEIAVLTSACKTADLIGRLESALTDQSVTTEGSQGQLVVTGLVTELRLQRLAQASLLKQVGLFELDEDGEAPKSHRHQMAAQARWGRRVAGF